MMADRPTQAVILAGGRGTRLAPITDTIPKPMVPFHGRPFLEYLIELLKQQGFKRVLLLLGYLAPIIQDHFGDGSRFGVEIDYSITPVEDDTGLRVWRARERLEPVFLLLYGDNYWPMPFEAMWGRFAAHSTLAMVTVYDNGDGYSKDNLRVDGEGFVTLYDKSRQAADLRGVELGFMILRRDILEWLPEGNISFEAALFPRLAQQRQLLAFTTNHRYYSVSTPQRLPVTEAFLARQPTILLDRDGVLNQKMPRARYVCSWGDWVWRPGSLAALRLFKAAGYRVIVITNQPGIARGMMTEADLGAIHARMQQEAAEAGGRIDAIYHCPHGWDEGCLCRKPRPGLLWQAQRDFHLDLSRVRFVGDDERDGEAAGAAGCGFVMLAEEDRLDQVAEGLLRSVLSS
ncbi:MAG: HAD-IIIA family hydrolase [Magnetococcus sp. DMHC-8]